HAHSLLFLGLVEQHQSAATTTEGAVTAPAHFNSPQTGNRIEHFARIVIHLVVPAQIAWIVVGVHVVLVLYRIEFQVAGLHFPRNHLADVLNWRHIFVVVLQCVVGVWIGGDD